MPSFTLLLPLLGFLGLQQAPDLDLVHVQDGTVVAHATLHQEDSVVSGKIDAVAVGVIARQKTDSVGFVTSYTRALRSRQPDHLIEKASLEILADGSGYRLREEGPLGARARTLACGRVQGIADRSWPEGLLPALLERDGGTLRVLDLASEEAVTVTIEPREGMARYADLPGGGITLEVGPDRTLRRLLLPGGALAIQPAGSPTAQPRAAAPPGVVEEEVALPGDGAPQGLIARPEAQDAAVPGVVLLPDSGRDRDGNAEDIQSDLLRDVAWDLAEAGFAVLRYAPRDPSSGAGWEQLKEDARAAGMLLRTRPGVDPRRVFIAGHGQGALVAAGAAGDRPDLFSAVLALAPPGLPLGDALDARLRARLRAQGASDGEIRTAEERLQEDLGSIRDLPAGAEPAPEERLLRDLLDVSPVDVFLRLKVPLLVLHAENDAEVPPSHRSLLRTALAVRAENPVRFQLITAADHEFREAREGPPGAGDLARRRQPALVPFITGFLEALVRR